VHPCAIAAHQIGAEGVDQVGQPDPDPDNEGASMFVVLALPH
jgi:hypothetical protein